jgi:hypothetical protein
VSARKIVRPGAASLQALERSRGSPEPADPGAYWAVDPGDGEHGREHFPPGPRGMKAAMKRALWLSVSDPPQRLLYTRPANRHGPAVTDKIIARYRVRHELSLVPGGRD